jgi:hypothetical protein
MCQRCPSVCTQEQRTEHGVDGARTVLTDINNFKERGGRENLVILSGRYWYKGQRRLHSKSHFFPLFRTAEQSYNTIEEQKSV